MRTEIQNPDAKGFQFWSNPGVLKVRTEIQNPDAKGFQWTAEDRQPVLTNRKLSVHGPRKSENFF